DVERPGDSVQCASARTLPERFRIALAVLDLLCDVATDAPLLVVAEDAQWLDRPTAEVLAFIARRVQSDPIVLLAATREGYPSPLVDAGLPEYTSGDGYPSRVADRKSTRLNSSHVAISYAV